MGNTIFTEGGHDAAFIEAYLKHTFGANIIESKRIKTIPIGGWTKLHLVSNEFEKTTNSGDTNLVIFDADFENNGGSFSVRRNELLKKADELNIKFEVFLFPNNEQDGDFETLLEQLFCPKHAKVPICFGQYENCLESLNTAEFTYITPSRKAKIFSYIEAITKPKAFEKAKKEDHYFYSSKEHWDLANGYLLPLKEFLKINLFT